MYMAQYVGLFRPHDHFNTTIGSMIPQTFYVYSIRLEFEGWQKLTLAKRQNSIGVLKYRGMIREYR